MKNNFITKIIGATLAFAMMIGGAVGINAAKQAKPVDAADSRLTPSAGSFIIDFYDSEKLSSTSGTGLTNSNYAAFVKVANGLTKTDVVTSVSVTGTVQYGKNGGLTAGTGTAASASTHYVTFNIGSEYAVNRCTVYATAYETGRWKLNNSVADSGSLGSKGATFANVTSPFVWNDLDGATSLTFKKDDGSNGNQKRLTIYTIVCEYTDSGSSNKTATTTEITVPENKTTLDLAVSLTDSVQLSAGVSYATGTISTPHISWTSSNTGAATVSETGLVTAVARGRTTITASYAGDETYNASSAHVDINVVNSAEITFDVEALAQEHSWNNGVAYTSVTVQETTIVVNGGGNNGKYYTSDKTWRMYNGGSLTITPPSGKSISAVTSTPELEFVIGNAGTYASVTFTGSVSLKSITVTLAAAKVLDSITASITNTSKVWRTNDVVQASDLTVVPHYTDGTDGDEITNGEGVTVTNGTLQNVGNNTVNVSYGGKSTTITVSALSSVIVEWGLSGQIGETVKSTSYNLSGLTLRGWYDNGKTDEASAAVMSGYELVANPATAGATADENNTIEVKVYATSDTGRTNCLKTFTDVPAPIIFAARGSEENPYSVEQARAAIDAGTGVNGVYVAGIVSQIVEPYSSEYHNISYNISSDGLTTSAQLEAFRGKSFDGENFTSEDDVEVGAAVVVYGNLVKYNSTYELAQNNRLVSYSISANSKVSHLDSHAALSYKYDKTGDGVLDALTLATTGVSGTSYTDWSGKTGASGAVYAGQSAAGNSSIQLRTKNSDSGIVTTNSGGKVTKVTVAWNSNTDEGRAINVYGKNTAYTSAAELYSENSDTSGALLGTIEKGESTELAITGDYEFIGIRSANSALYLDEIRIQWGEPVRFAFSNVAIRFGGSITPELWNELDTNEHNIAGFGVAYKKAGTFEGLLKNNIANVETADGQGFYKPVTAKAEGHPDLVNGKYLWNFYLRIPTIINEVYDEQYFDDNITAVAYIKLNSGEVVFLKETTVSIKSLAQSLLDDDAYDYDNSSFDGSLKYLADYTGE